MSKTAFITNIRNWEYSEAFAGIRRMKFQIDDLLEKQDTIIKKNDKEFVRSELSKMQKELMKTFNNVVMINGGKK